MTGGRTRRTNYETMSDDYSKQKRKKNLLCEVQGGKGEQERRWYTIHRNIHAQKEGENSPTTSKKKKKKKKKKFNTRGEPVVVIGNIHNRQQKNRTAVLSNTKKRELNLRSARQMRTKTAPRGEEQRHCSGKTEKSKGARKKSEARA